MMNAMKKHNEGRKTKLSWDDVHLIEINEAFAVVPIASKYILKKEANVSIDLENVNVNGGACSIGHPLAVSGLRIVTTLAKEMERRGESFGVASICIQGGLGGTTILERK